MVDTSKKIEKMCIHSLFGKYLISRLATSEISIF